MTHMLLLSGSSNQALADKIAADLNLSKVTAGITKFPNGEKKIQLSGDVHGQNIVIVQSFTGNVDEMIVEYLLLSDALERMGARHVNAIIPWLGYSLQDKVFSPGEPMSAKVIANLVSNSYTKRVILLDLHNNSIPGFFSVPTQLLSAMPIFVDYIKRSLNQNAVICSPDFGGLKRARDLAIQLGYDLVNIDKTRDLKSGQVTHVEVHGDVKGKTVILFDDCIVAGGTVVETSRVLKEQGAAAVHFIATHGLLVGDAKTKIQNSQVDSVVMTDSISHTDLPSKFQVVSVSPILSGAIKQWI